MPTSIDILDHATQITLDSIWNSMVQEAIQNSKTSYTQTTYIDETAFTDVQ